MLYRRWPTTADVLQGLALDSDSDMKPSDTVELAEFLPNESNSESNGVKGEATDQQSASTGWQILMKSFCLQNYAPLQNGHHVVTTAATIQFTSPKRVMSIDKSVKFQEDVNK